MNYKIGKLVVTLLMCTSINTAFARSGDIAANGGDIKCENDIRLIGVDIDSWIANGGSSELILPESVSLGMYNKKMKQSIEDTEVICVDKTVIAQGVPKTCINTLDVDLAKQYVSDDRVKKIVKSKKALIICNYNRYNELTVEEKYPLVHHEYAGLSGFEINSGEIESDYIISNQLTAYLEEQVIKKLSLTKRHHFKSVCKRSKDIREALESKLEKSCEQIIEADLKEIGRIELMSCEGVIRANDYSGLTSLYRLEIGCEITKAERGAFNGLDNLSSLWLDGFGKDISGKSFMGLDNLQEFFIFKNSVSKLPEDLFKYTPRLSGVMIHEHKNITEIPKSLFSNLINLSRLELTANNNITSLPEGMLKGLYQLSKVHIRENSNLTSLPAGFLKGHYEQLDEVRLNRNKITVIPADAFDSFYGENLSLLDLSSNGLRNLPRAVFSRIVTDVLDLSDNDLEVLDAKWFKLKTGGWGVSGANKFFAHNNRIQQVLDGGLFRALHTKSLHLSGNGISGVSAYFLQHLNAFEKLDLSSNLLGPESRNLIRATWEGLDKNLEL